MPKHIIIDEEAVIKDYTSSVVSVDTLATKYHVGKIRIREILNRNNVIRRKRGGQNIDKSYKLSDWKIRKYPEHKTCHYVAVAKNDPSFKTLDYMNNAGTLTNYISKKLGITIPSLYERREYYKLTGDYWWEQYFTIEKVPNGKMKRCPICGWKTTDVENKAGSFCNHITTVHDISPEDYLKEHPKDKKYFAKEAKKKERIELLKNKNNFVLCPICNEKLRILNETHLKNKHGLSVREFKEKYPDAKITSETTHKKLLVGIAKGNMNVSKRRFISKYEKEIQDFLTSKGIEFNANRQILGGQEIDILIKDKKIGIEFDGLYWHCEEKKKHRYHLNKTKMCNAHGYGLIHIFEDEYVNNKELVLKKLSHILGCDGGLPKIPGRKIIVTEIYKHNAEEFLNKYHIQGFLPSTLYLGGYYNGELVSVMTFRKGNMRNPNWELVRFATNDQYIYQGIGSKMFSYFVKTYSPDIVVSFADRRWTIDKTNNLYTKLGFFLENETNPSYSYFNKNMGPKRFHKFNFRRETLAKKYGLPLTMGETEMAKALGYTRIWDCGLFKYVWRRKEEIVDVVDET